MADSRNGSIAMFAAGSAGRPLLHRQQNWLVFIAIEGVPDMMKSLLAASSKARALHWHYLPARPIANDREAGAAAAKRTVPSWLAVITHVPPETKVAVEPATVQIPAVVEAKVSGLPEAPPVAESPTVWPGANVCAGGASKLMTCAA